MKKFLLNYFYLYVLVGLLPFMVVGCGEDDEVGNPVPNVPETQGIGTYSFRGEAGKIVSGIVSVEGDYISCLFSPEKMESEQTDTYFMFYLHTYWEGQVVEASTLYHNDQYFFVYEDPFYYYSQYKPVTGTFYVKRNSDTNVTVKLNLRMYDGVRFKAEVTTELKKSEPEESEQMKSVLRY